MTRRRRAHVLVDWRGPLGNRTNEDLAEGLAGLAGVLRSKPAQSVPSLIGIDLWIWPRPSVEDRRRGLAIFPNSDRTPISWAKIEADGDEEITCGACGRRVVLTDAWFASGRVVCPSCR